MQIQSISQLSTIQFDASQLSSISCSIEISKYEETTNKYDSYKLSLKDMMVWIMNQNNLLYDNLMSSIIKLSTDLSNQLCSMISCEEERVDTNFVTLDTEQTINGPKTFVAGTVFNNGIDITGGNFTVEDTVLATEINSQNTTIDHAYFNNMTCNSENIAELTARTALWS